MSSSYMPTYLRRGHISFGPVDIATIRRCAHPTGPAPRGGRPAGSRASILPAGPRTVITVMPPPVPARAALPGFTAKTNTGRATAITYMATVALSSNPRTKNPPNHSKRHRLAEWGPWQMRTW